MKWKWRCDEKREVEEHQVWVSEVSWMEVEVMCENVMRLKWRVDVYASLQ